MTVRGLRRLIVSVPADQPCGERQGVLTDPDCHLSTWWGGAGMTAARNGHQSAGEGGRAWTS
jgi:hypothetical protein